MPRKFTANGTFIPQDDAGNDMCILFMKFGRCRFKTKCKKSHWVPPLPDGPYPVEIKPPLPSDVPNKARINTTTNIKDSSNGTQNELLKNISQCYQSPKSTSVENINSNVSSKTDVPKSTNNCMLPRRFKHVFHEKCDNFVAENTGVSRLFNEAGAYFDNVTQKLQISEQPKNKIEKYHLKVLRRIHWRNMQSLKEKLSQYPPSYNLKFDRSKINFTRLRPYVYILIHECICVDGEKLSKPSSFEHLIADTLLAYLDSTCITPQEAEEKLRQWGARAVRARQCITHLWHILAISSKSPHGCAKDVIRIEEEVVQGKRTSLDYSSACAFALKRDKLKTTVPENSHFRRKKINTSIKQGLETKRFRKTKLNALRGTHVSMTTRRETGDGKNAKDTEKHVTKGSGHRHERIEHAEIVIDHARISIEHDVGKVTVHAEKGSEHVKNANEHTQGKITHEKTQEKIAPKDSDGQKQVLCNRIGKKRKRSRQFKNVPFNERKMMKTRCVQLLSFL